MCIFIKTKNIIFIDIYICIVIMYVYENYRSCKSSDLQMGQVCVYMYISSDLQMGQVCVYMYISSDLQMGQVCVYMYISSDLQMGHVRVYSKPVTRGHSISVLP